ncbi:MAG: heme-binding domain-containing protein [Bacteroidota bacterium]|nr:heme-binding domain-containing protein [Bacteroidota bacterium]
MKKAFKIIVGIVLLFGLIQLIPVDKLNPLDVQGQSFVEAYSPPVAVQKILEQSCYDCHSNHTQYPSYANIAPISWVVRNHVKKGRRYLNLSEWGSYNIYQKESLIKKIPQSILYRKMPLPLYLSYHPQAELSEEQIQVLVDYFEQLDPNEL